jgi:hypothetical protein
MNVRFALSVRNTEWRVEKSGSKNLTLTDSAARESVRKSCKLAFITDIEAITIVTIPYVSLIAFLRKIRIIHLELA